MRSGELLEADSGGGGPGNAPLAPRGERESSGLIVLDVVAASLGFRLAAA